MNSRKFSMRVCADSIPPTLSLRSRVCADSIPPTLSLRSRVWRNWQTRWIQVPVTSRSYRFKSCYPHQKAIGFRLPFLFSRRNWQVKSRSGSDSPPDCHSLPSRRFATRWIQVPVTSRSYRFKSAFGLPKEISALKISWQ